MYKTNLLHIADTACIYRIDTLLYHSTVNSKVVKLLKDITPLEDIRLIELQRTLTDSWRIRYVHTHTQLYHINDAILELMSENFHVEILNHQTSIWSIDTKEPVWQLEHLKVLNCELRDHPYVFGEWDINRLAVLHRLYDTLLALHPDEASKLLETLNFK